MIVLDTSALVYATGGDHRFRDPCRRLIAAITDQTLKAVTTTEVIQEFTHVRARRHGRRDAVALGRRYAALLSPQLETRPQDLERGLDLFAQGTHIGAFDAVLAAVAIGAAATALVSTDSDFRDVHGLEHVVPDEAGVAALLRESAS